MSAEGRPEWPPANSSSHVSPPQAAPLARNAITFVFPLLGILDIGLGTIDAGGGFGVPFAVRSLVFDDFGASRRALFLGGALGSGECRGMGRKTFRKYAVDGVGPAAVVLDDLVGD